MRNDLLKYIFIVIGGAILFLPFLGHVHLFDWDEINFAEAAREMLLTQNYMRVQIDFQPFWEKPPLFIWMQALSMSIFGINEFAARFPNALFGIITLCTLFYIGKKVVNERAAWYWVLLYAGSWLTHFYFKTAIIDPVFNFFIFLAFFQVFKVVNTQEKTKHALLSGLFLGLAVLTKGPVAILVALLSLLVYIIINKGFWGFGKTSLLWLTLSCFIVSFSWFGIDIIQNGWWFTETFITYQIRLLTTGDAGHSGPFFYHFIVLLIGCFPASVFLLKKWKRPMDFNMKAIDFLKWMWILFWVNLILFSIVKTKIVHYSSLCYFPLTFIAAYHLSKMERFSKKTIQVFRGMILGIGIIWSIILIALPIIGNHKELLIPLIQDDFAVANMEADVHFSYFAILAGVFYLTVLIIGFRKLKTDFNRGILQILILQIIIIPFVMIYYTPKMEAFSQRAAIEFFKEFKGKDVYVVPLGYKSYAHLFYTQKQDMNSEKYENLGHAWLLHEQTEKPVYFICKNTYEQEALKNPNLIKVGSKNGFSFFKKED